MRHTRRTKLLTALAVGTAGLLLTVPGQALAGPDPAADGRGQARAGKADVVPLSAVETVTRTEAKADGTLKTTREKGRLYRDSAGRTRHESGSQVTISDPATGTTVVLDTGKREYTRSVAPKGEAGKPQKASPKLPQAQQKQISSAPRDLGTATIAGVRAKGTNYTVTIPSMDNKGTVSKDLTVWLSTDLKLDLRTRVTEKSGAAYEKSYTDVRTGTEPSASLFTVPSGYHRATPSAAASGDCPVDISPDPLILTSYSWFLDGRSQVGYTNFPDNACLIIDTAAIVEYPLWAVPVTPYLGLPFFEWYFYDTGGPVPYPGYIALGSAGFLAYSTEDTSQKWSLVVLYIF